MNGGGNLVVRYGGRWASLYSIISAILILCVVVVSMPPHLTSMNYLFIGYGIYLMADAFVIREIVFDHPRRIITRQWLLPGELCLYRRHHSFDDYQAILLRWQASRFVQNLGGRGSLDVFLVGRERRNLVLQTYPVSDSAISCPEADILVQEVKELTDFPTESVERTGPFS